MERMTAEWIVTRVPMVHCAQSAQIIETAQGLAVKITGKGAKLTAKYYCRELYYDGILETDWQSVRHGLGYLIPFYNNPTL